MEAGGRSGVARLEENGFEGFVVNRGIICVVALSTNVTFKENTHFIIPPY